VQTYEFGPVDSRDAYRCTVSVEKDLSEIEINNLSFTYENRVEPALEKINVNINSREFVLLAGASGSGKSTLP